MMKKTILGPMSLRLEVTLKPDASAADVDLVNIYARGLVHAWHSTSSNGSQTPRHLQLPLVAMEWSCLTGAPILELSETATPEIDGVSKILHILLESNNEVPEQRQAEWCDRILNIATTLNRTDLSHLKAGFSAAVWSALVYCGIHPTPARTLEDIRVCKVHCLNCVRKKHPSASVGEDYDVSSLESASSWPTSNGTQMGQNSNPSCITSSVSPAASFGGDTCTCRKTDFTEL
ncbi:hypothetical protein ARMGADRAFT_1028434 [Armillaria gallica]|uniref:Uncharacterized protein n=1 Tax=Armillaria gallica TaxID=47427 RepID=A0A2H3E4J8_ARMGA|nr:hypothetical protein ARMGADRAFT_1028434 [Armillaria gallica]